MIKQWLLLSHYSQNVGMQKIPKVLEGLKKYNVFKMFINLATSNWSN